MFVNNPAPYNRDNEPMQYVDPWDAYLPAPPLPPPPQSNVLASEYEGGSEVEEVNRTVLGDNNNHEMEEDRIPSTAPLTSDGPPPTSPHPPPPPQQQMVEVQRQEEPQPYSTTSELSSDKPNEATTSHRQEVNYSPQSVPEHTEDAAAVQEQSPSQSPTTAAADEVGIPWGHHKLGRQKTAKWNQVSSMGLYHRNQIIYGEPNLSVHSSSSSCAVCSLCVCADVVHVGGAARLLSSNNNLSTIKNPQQFFCNYSQVY